MDPTLERLCINALRMLSIDAVQKANSGHPGMPLGAATMAFVLWTRHLRHDPQNPFWPDRDRFVLSAGHASALLYSLLFLSGYDLSLNDLQHFRQWKSATPGHPERAPALRRQPVRWDRELGTRSVWQSRSNGWLRNSIATTSML